VVVRVPTDAISGGEVRFNDRYAWEGLDYAPLRRQAPLVRYAVDGPLEYWSADLELRPPRLRYRFGLDTVDGRRWYGWDGLRDTPAPRGSFEFAYVAEGDLPDSPAWARGATFYQIFPERFARGAQGHRRGPVSDWDGLVDNATFLGGDLDGITDRLDHIASLSVDALYLTPIFSSPSSHKYDTTDYFSVDPDFGGNAALRRLVNAAHARSMRVVLDGVFNHAGALWPPFVDARERGSASPYADWFYFSTGTTDGPGYETWATNVASMPKLRTSEPALRDLILRVGRFWVQEFGIDGWRLDVANEVDHNLWRAFRASVRSVNPDAFLVGEIWEGALPWLRGDQFDSTMNYPLRTAILDFAGAADATLLLDRIDRLRAAYPESIHHLLYNLLGSHDAERPLTVLGGERRRMALASGLLYALPGIVSLYYGDEVGMEGGKDDHGNRRGMIWQTERQDARQLAIFRRLGELRRSRSALRLGAYERLLARDGLVAFGRGLADERLVVLANGAARAASIPESDLVSWLGGPLGDAETIAYDDVRAALRPGALHIPAMSMVLVAPSSRRPGGARSRPAGRAKAKVPA
jgi:glycosidase